jgi:hypothetical protein
MPYRRGALPASSARIAAKKSAQSGPTDGVPCRSRCLMDAVFEAIRVGLERLQSTPVESGDLIAGRHRYRLNPPLREDEVRRFEAVHQILLPSDYRDFLTQLGNGGAGPGYGLEMLGHFCGITWNENPGLVGELARPFPYSDSWNAEPVDDTRPVDEQYRQQDEYWSSRHVNGALPVCDQGCNLRECLIVTGPERGNMWIDDRADWMGLYPNHKGGCDRLTFLAWYRMWLDERLLKVE